MFENYTVDAHQNIETYISAGKTNRVSVIFPSYDPLSKLSFIAVCALFRKTNTNK